MLFLLKKLISFCIWTFICIVKNFPLKHFIKLQLHFKTVLLILRKHSSFLKNLKFFLNLKIGYFISKQNSKKYPCLLFERIKKKFSLRNEKKICPKRKSISSFII